MDRAAQELLDAIDEIVIAVNGNNITEGTKQNKLQLVVAGRSEGRKLLLNLR